MTKYLLCQRTTKLIYGLNRRSVYTRMHLNFILRFVLSVVFDVLLLHNGGGNYDNLSKCVYLLFVFLLCLVVLTILFTMKLTQSLYHLFCE